MLGIAILDDYQHVALDMADWSKLGSDVELAFFDTHIADLDEAAEALADFEVLVFMRERMNFPRALIERLPKLRYVVFTGSHSTVIDFAALAERGIPASRTGARASPGAAGSGVAAGPSAVERAAAAGSVGTGATVTAYVPPPAASRSA